MSKSIRLPIGKRLKAERKRLGLTQAEASNLCGVTQATLVGYESGLRALPSDIANTLFKCGFDVSYIVTGQSSSSMGTPEWIHRIVTTCWRVFERAAEREQVLSREAAVRVVTYALVQSSFEVPVFDKERLDSELDDIELAD